MEEEIENLIEELTKVRPEMLNEEALKLFNTIIAVLDERDKLKKENQELLEVKISASAHQRIAELEKQNQELINELQDKDDEIRFANRDIKVFETEFIPKSKIKEQILNPMKEEHDKAITGFMKRDIPQCLEDGGIAQVLGCFIGKIEELMEDK